MTDTDYDAKAQGGLEKVKSVATDTAGHKSGGRAGDSGEDLDKTEGETQKNTDRDGNASNDFVEAKKKV